MEKLHAPVIRNWCNNSGLRSAVGRASDSRARAPGSIPGPATYFDSPSIDSRRAVVNYFRKNVHKVQVNCLGGLSLPWKREVRLTDRPDMTLADYHGHKTTTQQHWCHNEEFLSRH